MTLGHPCVQRTLQPLSLEAFGRWKPYFALPLPGYALVGRRVADSHGESIGRSELPYPAGRHSFFVSFFC
jgi:hypothetical protein